jgi:hydroxymethylbilane synthase
MAAIKVGTRASALALWQTRHVVGRLTALDPTLEFEIVTLSTAGDELVDAPLERMEGTGFFTSTIERALLAGAIDLAVHSYKDLPTLSTPGLGIAAVPERAPVEDVLVGRNRRSFSQLSRGARIGTSSPRRTAQIRAMRPDLEFVALRGNVPTRIERVERGDLEGAVLARAGLERLGLIAHASEIFPLSSVLPAPAQGALALQTRASETRCAAALAAFEHGPTRRAIVAERAVLHALRGGCSVPVGAFAFESNGDLVLEAGVFDPEGGPGIRVRMTGRESTALGERMARALLDRGAGRILDQLERAPRVAAPSQP